MQFGKPVANDHLNVTDSRASLRDDVKVAREHGDGEEWSYLGTRSNDRSRL